jgi:anthranilate phosphoribosyltransferase
LRAFTVAPEEAGLSRAPVAAIRGGDAAFNAAARRALLDRARSPYRDTLALNAAAALNVARRARDLREGVATADRALASGAALAALERLRQETVLAATGAGSPALAAR